jgi:hypothetical protein
LESSFFPAFQNLFLCLPGETGFPSRVFHWGELGDFSDQRERAVPNLKQDYLGTD